MAESINNILKNLKDMNYILGFTFCLKQYYLSKVLLQINFAVMSVVTLKCF